MKLYACGSNGHGQLGIHSLDDVHVFTRCTFDTGADTLPSDAQIISIAAGANHALAILEFNESSAPEPRRQLWGCGDGRRGQLGPYITSGTCQTVWRRLDVQHFHGLEKYTEYRVRHISACWETTYVALSPPPTLSFGSDVLVAMGANDYGDLGCDSTDNKTIHVVPLHHGLDSTMAKISIRNLAAGVHHVVAHISTTNVNGSIDDFLIGWGSCRHSQLGSDFLTPAELAVKRRPAYVSVPRLVKIDHSEPAVSLAMGNQHTVLMHASGRITAMGSDAKGQLRGVSEWDGVVGIGCTWNGTYAVLRTKSGALDITATGSSSKGQLGVPASATDSDHPTTVLIPFGGAGTHRIRQLACGSEHVLALFDVTSDEGQNMDEVWGWGWNEHGNLGTAETKDVHLPVKIWPSPSVDDERKVAGIWAGCGTSWIAVD